MQIEWDEAAGRLVVVAATEGERRYVRRLLAGPLRPDAPSAEASLFYEVMAQHERTLVRTAGVYHSPDNQVYADEAAAYRARASARREEGSPR